MGFALSAFEERILPLVTKPSRYIAPFTPAVAFDVAAGRVLVLVPATFEAALAGARVRGLLHALDRAGAGEPPVFADVLFRPADDLTALLDARRMPLPGLVSRRAAAEFDLVLLLADASIDLPAAFGMLDRSGVPPLRTDRDAAHPAVLLVGDAAFAPGPASAYVDAALPGDPEAWTPALLRLARDRRPGGMAAECLAAHGIAERPVEPRWLAGAPSLPAAPLAPLPEVERDGLPVEIARGRGPRVAGLLPLGLRHHPVDAALHAADAALAASGYAELVLDGDSARHPELVAILERLHQRLGPLGVTARLQEVDPAAFCPALGRELVKGNRARLAFHPVLTSEALRLEVLNPLPTEAFVRAVESALRGGWSQLVLSVVVGAPGEKETDRREFLAALSDAARLPARGSTSPRVTVDIRPWVPHPGVLAGAFSMPPGSWSECLASWRAGLPRGGRLRLQAEALEPALLEAAFRADDPRVAPLFAEAVRRGLGRPGPEPDAAAGWKDLIRDLKVDLQELVQFGDIGAATGFLDRGATIDLPGSGPAGDAPAAAGFGVPGWVGGRRVKRGGRGREARRADRYRIRFAKGEALRFTSHLDVARGLERAFRRAQVPLAMTQGKDRRPRFSFGPPLPLGMTSGAEYLDVSFSREVPESFTSVMNAMLPEGLSLVAAAPIRNDAASLSSAVEIADYEVWFPDSIFRDVFGDVSFDDLKERLKRRVDEALASDALPVTRVRKDRTETVNVRPSLIRVEVIRDDGGRPVLSYRLTLNRSDSVRPEVLTAALCDWADFDERLPRVHRSALSIPARQGTLDPLDVVRADFAWWRHPVKGGTVV